MSGVNFSSQQPEIDEVNFWQQAFRRREPYNHRRAFNIFLDFAKFNADIEEK